MGYLEALKKLSAAHKAAHQAEVDALPKGKVGKLTVSERVRAPEHDEAIAEALADLEASRDGFSPARRNRRKDRVG